MTAGVKRRVYKGTVRTEVAMRRRAEGGGDNTGLGGTTLAWTRKGDEAG